MKLYDAAPSGNCQKARMMLVFLGLENEKVNISLPDQAQKTPEHLARHPLGKVPALEDGDVTVWDSQAILVYLARKYDSGGTWFPTDPVGQAHVTQWLSFAAKEMWDGPATARAIPKFNRPGDHCGGPRFGAGDDPNRRGPSGRAGLACRGRRDNRRYRCLSLYRPYLGRSGRAHVISERDCLMRRIEALPNYVGMDGLPH